MISVEETDEGVFFEDAKGAVFISYEAVEDRNYEAIGKLMVHLVESNKKETERAPCI